MDRFHALLVEGVPGIGKSTLIDALIRRHVVTSDARRIRSLLHLAQSHTYGPLAPAEDRGTLTPSENARLLDRLVGILEVMHDELQHCAKPCFVVIDSLHLTHCLRPGVLTWQDAEPFDRRLARIGCRLLLLVGSEETLRARTVEARRGSQFLDEYALKFGQTPEAIHSHFVREQVAFRNLFEKSTLEKRVFENDGTLDTIVGEAYEFWTQEEPKSALMA